MRHLSENTNEKGVEDRHEGDDGAAGRDHQGQTLIYKHNNYKHKQNTYTHITNKDKLINTNIPNKVVNTEAAHARTCMRVGMSSFSPPSPELQSEDRGTICQGCTGKGIGRQGIGSLCAHGTFLMWHRHGHPGVVFTACHV